MRNVSDKICRENENRHFVLTNMFNECSAVYEIMWKNMVEPDSPQVDNIIRRIRSAYGITQATDRHTHTHTYTHTEYVTLIALPRQHRLGECPSVLRLYVRCQCC